ncbi:conserved glutamic acid-rich protein [Aspergillus terreus]|uniref:Conserved glutamic acid-rich protein n=1 Tax=Aspergillus terreus TaxID=33178 RepID=A0A5M3Z7X8_ASPTE|nr:hypothetical protein ATETN484_0010036700 [Aspergillus terreus]GFF18414.1 conserved glutamic acid-rich protein [Aspergillus terreus]
MGPRSNATRKRKRNTTSQALDLLNGVNSTNNQTRHSLPRISRNLRASLPRPPRSDNIFDIPSSPQFVPNSQPLTPRRSTRLQQSSPADPTATRTSSQHVPNSQPFTPRRAARARQSSPANPTPTRRSLRHKDAGQASHGADVTSHPLDTGGQADPDEDEAPHTYNEGNEGENENVGFEALNEDNAPSLSSESPHFPPPSVIVHQALLRKSVDQEPSHSDDGSAGADSSEAQHHTPPPERRREFPGLRASLNPQMVGMESVVGPNADPNDNESNVASDSDSRHTSPERDTSPVIPNERRQSVDKDDELYHPDGSSQSDSDAQSKDESDDDMDDFWFTEAKKLGGHEETWRKLIENKREMEEAASSAGKDTFKDIENIISRLGSLYRDGIEHLLLASLNKGKLMPVSYSRPVVQHQHTRTDDSQRPWTDDEGKVLIAALRRYTGSGRYMTISTKYRDRLRGRTPGDLRAEARRIHDRLLPGIQSRLDLPGVREQFQWLLSVPYD